MRDVVRCGDDDADADDDDAVEGGDDGFRREGRTRGRRIEGKKGYEMDGEAAVE